MDDPARDDMDLLWRRFAGYADHPFLLFWSPFNTRRFRSARTGREWTRQRFRHWLTFTLPSVLAQSHQDFVYWLVCDPGLRALTEPLRGSIRDSRVHLVYSDECAELFRQLPPRSRYLLARLDSDDMYHPRVAGALAGRQPRATFLQFNRGFACDIGTGQVRQWVSRSSPFYCEVRGEEIRSSRWAEPDHTKVRPQAEVLGPGHFLVLLHEQNTTSTIDIGGEQLHVEAARRTLRAFGLGQPRELMSLLACVPGSADWHGRWLALRNELRPFHEQYVQQSTEAESVTTLEGATFLAFLCEAIEARSVLDVGGGFASVVAARYAARHAGTEVRSVLSPGARVPAIGHLAAHVTHRDWGSLRESSRAEHRSKYDIVVVSAVSGLPLAGAVDAGLRSTHPTGLAIVDAWHEPERVAIVRRHLRRYVSSPVVDSPSLTQDRAGRCSLVISRLIGPL